MPSWYPQPTAPARSTTSRKPLDVLRALRLGELPYHLDDVVKHAGEAGVELLVNVAEVNGEVRAAFDIADHQLKRARSVARGAAVADNRTPCIGEANGPIAKGVRADAILDGLEVGSNRRWIGSQSGVDELTVLLA